MTHATTEIRKHLDDQRLHLSVEFLRNYEARTDPGLYMKSYQSLANLKREAVENGDQSRAKSIWCLETIAKIQDNFITAFQCLCSGQFKEAWHQLARCETEAAFLSDHFVDDAMEFGVGFIGVHTQQFQELFPLGLGTSPELVIEEMRCSICDVRITLRNDCGHEPGEIYDGEMCSRVAGKMTIIGVSLVTNPVQKSTMIFPDEDKRERFYPIQQLAQSLGSPWQPWRIHKEERRLHHPSFRMLGRNDACACGSGLKYKRCCLQKDTVFPHYQVYLIGEP